MDAAQGFSAQGAGAAVILASTHFGFPLSTTHVINGGVMGAGAGKRVSAVRWGVAGNIIFAWLLTLPAAAAIGAVTYGVTRDLRRPARWGRSLVSDRSPCSLVAFAFARRSQQGAPVPASWMMLAVLVETKELAETVVASLVGGVGVTVIFSIAIWGGGRFVDLSRSERPLAAAGAAAVGSRSRCSATLASVVLGIDRDDQQVARGRVDVSEHAQPAQRRDRAAAGARSSPSPRRAATPPKSS